MARTASALHILVKDKEQAEDIIAKLNQAVNVAAQSKDIQEKFAGIGFAVEPGTPEALAQRSKAETAKWAKAIADAKIEPQ